MAVHMVIYPVCGKLTFTVSVGDAPYVSWRCLHPYFGLPDVPLLPVPICLGNLVLSEDEVIAMAEAADPAFMEVYVGTHCLSRYDFTLDYYCRCGRGGEWHLYALHLPAVSTSQSIWYSDEHPYPQAADWYMARFRRYVRPLSDDDMNRRCAGGLIAVDSGTYGDARVGVASVDN